LLAKPGYESPRNKAVSIKKLKASNGSWTTRKVVLGWVLETIHQTMEIPAHRKLLVTNILRTSKTTSE
jgi:hypothetical protein